MEVSQLTRLIVRFTLVTRLVGQRTGPQEKRKITQVQIVDVKFETPEEHFLKHKTRPYELPKFNPKSLSQTDDICKLTNAELTLKQQEMILMVGSPGSGKLHFAKNYLKEYEYVNRDTLRSWQKFIVAIQQYLNQGKRKVMDNTNPDPASRKRYIEIAKKHNVLIRCFVMTIEDSTKCIYLRVKLLESSITETNKSCMIIVHDVN